jgi:NADPH:quinone reductase-like Zn-dependent oxidoreductase
MMAAVFLECQTPSTPPNLALARREIPPPKASQVQVAVSATSVNPIDVKRAGGYGRRVLGLKGAGRFPIILGNDVVGFVVAVGCDVGSVRIGDYVMGALPTGPQGAHASHVNIAADLVAPVVEGYSYEELAALPYSFTTLWLAFQSIGLSSESARDRDVLVNGASGAIGRMALQLLVHWGARVTAVCSTGNIETCRRLGATTIVDRLVSSISQIPERFDFTLNFGSWEDEEMMIARLKKTALGSATTCHPILSNCDESGLFRGLIRSLADHFRLRRQATLRAPNVRYRWTVYKADRGALLALRELLASRIISIPIGFSAPLEDGALAFAHVAAGRQGRAILKPKA